MAMAEGQGRPLLGGYTREKARIGSVYVIAP